MTDAQQLIDSIRAAAQGSPFTVQETPAGFDLHADLAHPYWRDAFNRRSDPKAYRCHVRLDGEKGRLVIEDDLVTSSRIQGVSRTRGRVYQKGFSKEWTFGGGAKPEKVVDASYDLSAGRHLITSVSEPLGWKESLPASAKFALVVGVGTLVLLALSGIVLLVL